MIVTIETTFTSHYTTRATFLPFVVKHCIANLLKPIFFADLRVVAQIDRLFSVLHDCSSFRYRFFLRSFFFEQSFIRFFCYR